MHRDSTFVVLLATLLAVIGQFRAFAQGECEPWQVLGGSMNDTVHALTVFDDGSGPALYAGGWFTTAGGVAANHIARWDGEAWTPLGSGMSSGVAALTVFDDGSGPALYAGGGFTTAGGVAANRIARWDGSAWTPLGSGMNGGVAALTVFDDGSGPALYAGGSFTTAGGVPASNIARWDGSSWSSLGSGVNGTVTTMAVYDDVSGEALYAGGWFSQAGGVPARHIAGWDGMQWYSIRYSDSFPILGNLVVVQGDGRRPLLFIPSSFCWPGLEHDCSLFSWDGYNWGGQYVPGHRYVWALGAHQYAEGQQQLLVSGEVAGCEINSYYSYYSDCSRYDRIKCYEPGIVSVRRPHSHQEVVLNISHDLGSADALVQFPRADGNTIIGVFDSGHTVLERTNRCVDVYVSGDVIVESAAAALGAYLDYEYSGFVIQPRRTASAGLTSSGFGGDRASGSWQFDATVAYGQQSTILSVRSFMSGEVVASGLHGSAQLQLGPCDSSMHFTIDEPLDYTLDEDLTGVGIVLQRRFDGDPIVGRRLQPGDYSIVPVGYRVSLFVESGTLADARRLNFDLTLTRPQPCRADLDGDGELTIFDFLAFQNAFAAMDPIADFDGDGQFTIFDFLVFGNEFAAGCP